MTDPCDRPPPRIAALLRALRDHEVNFVLSGSAVLAVYGAGIAPNDLDVVPALDSGNLARLAGMLGNINPVPAHDPESPSAPSYDECLQWTPDPPTVQRLDRLLVTDLGLFDVEPENSGGYEQLRAGASYARLGGVDTLVCDPDEVLTRLPQPPRRKDRRRAAAYQAVREVPATDRRTRDLAHWHFPPMP